MLPLRRFRGRYKHNRRPPASSMTALNWRTSAFITDNNGSIRPEMLSSSNRDAVEPDWANSVAEVSMETRTRETPQYVTCDATHNRPTPSSRRVPDTRHQTRTPETVSVVFNRKDGTKKVHRIATSAALRGKPSVAQVCQDQVSRQALLVRWFLSCLCIEITILCMTRLSFAICWPHTFFCK